jgi:hypothetical protein
MFFFAEPEQRLEPLVLPSEYKWEPTPHHADMISWHGHKADFWVFDDSDGKNKYGFLDVRYDYYADDAESVVFMSGSAGYIGPMYVMLRADAKMFCASDETEGRGRSWKGVGGWCFAFTSVYRDTWRKWPKKVWLKDDGRFKTLMEMLDIVPIYPKR